MVFFTNKVTLSMFTISGSRSRIKKLSERHSRGSCKEQSWKRRKEKEKFPVKGGPV